MVPATNGPSTMQRFLKFDMNCYLQAANRAEERYAAGAGFENQCSTPPQGFVVMYACRTQMGEER
jgi:hypothetical protein